MHAEFLHDSQCNREERDGPKGDDQLTSWMFNSGVEQFSSPLNPPFSNMGLLNNWQKGGLLKAAPL